MPLYPPSGGSSAITSPIEATQATGSFTVETGKFAIQGLRLTLTASERGTVEGTGRLIICG